MEAGFGAFRIVEGMQRISHWEESGDEEGAGGEDAAAGAAAALAAAAAAAAALVLARAQLAGEAARTETVWQHGRKQQRRAPDS